MTRGQLKTRVARILGIALGTGDDEAADTALLEELANEAVIDILSRTRVNVRDGTVALSAGITEYEIDPTLILAVYGVGLTAADGSTADLLKHDRDHMGTSDFSIPGLNRISFGRTSVSGDVLRLWYTPTPTPMTDDSHDPALLSYGAIPSAHHRAIVDYMCWHAADKMGDQGAGRGEKYRIMYEGQNGQGMLGSDLGRIKWATNTRAGASTVKSPRRVLRGDLTPSYWQG